jgi:hypothetical protein
MEKRSIKVVVGGTNFRVIDDFTAEVSPISPWKKHFMRIPLFRHETNVLKS